MEASPTNHGDDTLEQLFPWILVTTIVVAIVIIAGIFIVIRREKRLKETEFKFNSSFGS